MPRLVPEDRPLSESERIVLRERLLTQCVIGDGGCWNWTAGHSASGYARSALRGKAVRANRLAMLILKGIEPGDLYVLHRCDNPSCINPDHLFLGTAGDNAHDMIGKGRQRWVPARGERSRTAKLTDADVVAIRERYAAGTLINTLRKEYGVKWDTIRDVVTRKSWSHVA